MTIGQRAAAAAPPDGRSEDVVDRPSRERTPWLLGFLCLLIPMLPSYLVPAGPLKSHGSPARLIAFAFFGLAVLAFLLIRRTSNTRTVRPGVVILVAYFLTVLAVYAVGLSHLDNAVIEASKTRAIIFVIASVGIGLCAATRVETLRQRSIVLGCLAIGLTFNCVVGVLQNATHIDLHWLFEPPGFVSNETDQGHGLTALIVERFGAKRAFGTSGHAIEFSVLAAVAVPLTIHLARFAASRQIRLLAALAAGVALLAVPAGVSRSGVFALAAALLVYMWAFRLRQLAVAVVVGAAAIGLQFAVAPGNAQALVKSITNSSEDASITERVADYTKVSQTFHDHPLFGLGLGASLPSQYGFLDNEWLQALVQGGTVGFLAMVVLAGGGIFGISAALRRATTRPERDQAYAMGAMMVGVLSSSFSFDLFSYQQATFVFFVLFGLLWSDFTVSVPRDELASAVMRPKVFDHAR